MPKQLLNAAISSAKVTALTIPTEQPESDGTAEWDSTTVVIVEVSGGGASGLGYSYCNKAAAQISEELLKKEVIGKNAFDIEAIHAALDRQVRNWGRPGLVSNAISAIDTALWDLKARILGQPLALLLGRQRNETTAYGSGGFTSYSEKQLVNQLSGWASDGFEHVKMKIGRHPDRDVQRVTAVQKALRGKAELFVDANGAYRRKQALEKSRIFGDLGVRWFEEPVTSDDRIGLRMLVKHAPPIMRIAAGEYTYVLDDARLLLEAHAVDVLQADVTRCGGVTNFLKIGQACEIYHFPYSAHTCPSVHASICCSLAAAINIEYFYDHARIEHMIFEGAITPKAGKLAPDLSQPGLGLELKRQDAQKFEVFSTSLS
jgi:L-alanine-DL-glutamate epimerase-like enolase superfamily enzyme